MLIKIISFGTFNTNYYHLLYKSKSYNYVYTDLDITKISATETQNMINYFYPDHKVIHESNSTELTEEECNYIDILYGSDVLDIVKSIYSKLGDL